MQQDHIRRYAEIVYIVLILVIAVVLWREASKLPPAPYDPLGPKSFPIWVSYGLAALAVAMLVNLAFGRRLGRAAYSMIAGFDGESSHALSPWTAVLTLLLAFLYAIALSFRSVSFLPATIVYLFLAGAVLGPVNRRRLIITAVFAVVAASALDFIFRVVFKLDLT